MTANGTRVVASYGAAPAGAGVQTAGDSAPPTIPAAAWCRRLDETRALSPGKPVGLAPSMLVTMFPVIARTVRNMVRDKLRGVEASVWTHGTRAEPIMGVPLGGLGGGTITRGWRGQFVRWQMRPGVYERRVVPVDQFSLWVRRDGSGGQSPEGGPENRPSAVVLAPRPASGPLRDLPAIDPAQATYYALFPQAWTVYEEPVPGTRVVCRQLSPVIPHNYKEASYPVAAFVFTVTNTSGGPADVALMFTWQNGTGGPADRAGGHVNEAFGSDVVRGVCLRNRTYGDPLTFAIGARTEAGVEVSRRCRFTAGGRPRGATAGGATVTFADVWRDFAEDGRLDDPASATCEAPASPPTPPPSGRGEAIGAAVAARTRVPAGESCELVFVLAWDMPVARFGSGRGWYRRYTTFFGRDGKAAPALAREAIAGYRRWEGEIEAWQKPILDAPSLPDWYKSLLFNETYYLVDGGTIWTAGEAPPVLEPPVLPEPPIGHFAYLEGHEYRMYNTYDVHFSASFALATLWPELELGLQRDFARAVMAEDSECVTFVGSGTRGPRKTRGAVPHDLGTPGEDPWHRLNAYDVQDVGRWKDLGPKFVLQAYRDYRLAAADYPWLAAGGHPWLAAGGHPPQPASGERVDDFLRDVWPAVLAAVDHMRQFDRDADGLIENEGFPDQTYDAWTAKGPSAYSACLWLASLEAAASLAEAVAGGTLDDGGPARERRVERVAAVPEPATPPCSRTAARAAAKAAEWRNLLARGKASFETRLWNGEYYLYDASGGRHSANVMADQLSGQWFSRAAGLPDVVPAEHYRSVLDKVYALNVMGWAPGRARGCGPGRGSRGAAAGRATAPRGERGAVNGMTPDGRLDRTSLQSQEVWVGTTLSLAAAMLQEGMTEKAFRVARGAYLSVYRDFPLWFQTPEAINVDGVYRSIGYMRPLAVWAMQWEIDRLGQRERPDRIGRREQPDRIAAPERQ